jgi:hypothetical protein
MIISIAGQQSKRLLRVTISCLIAFGFAVAVFTATEAQRGDEIPVHSIPQNAPCPDQPKSLKELTQAFNEGRIPSRSEMTGTWMAISSFIADYEKSLDCSGLKRGARLYEQVILANGYLLEMHFIGAGVQTPTMKPDRTRSLSFPFDFGGDANPVFRCRLTTRKTLACLLDVYRQGNEFKRSSVRPDKMNPNSIPR